MKNEHDNTADVRLERTVSLRPCPFCDGNAEAFEPCIGRVAVECKLCLARVESKTECSAKFLWNRRALDSVERRQWEVGEDGRALYSEDFTHDVKLTIDGDWASDEQRMTYAQHLANVLNKQANR